MKPSRLKIAQIESILRTMARDHEELKDFQFYLDKNNFDKKTQEFTVTVLRKIRHPELHFDGSYLLTDDLKSQCRGINILQFSLARFVEKLHEKEENE